MKLNRTVFTEFAKKCHNPHNYIFTVHVLSFPSLWNQVPVAERKMRNRFDWLISIFDINFIICDDTTSTFMTLVNTSTITPWNKAASIKLENYKGDRLIKGKFSPNLPRHLLKTSILLNNEGFHYEFALLGKKCKFRKKLSSEIHSRTCCISKARILTDKRSSKIENKLCCQLVMHTPNEIFI